MSNRGHITQARRQRLTNERLKSRRALSHQLAAGRAPISHESISLHCSEMRNFRLAALPDLRLLRLLGGVWRKGCCNLRFWLECLGAQGKCTPGALLDLSWILGLETPATGSPGPNLILLQLQSRKLRSSLQHRESFQSLRLTAGGPHLHGLFGGG
jgi:hypothetical protein